MSEHLLLALDEGTSSTRAIVFDRSGSIRGVSQVEFEQIFPKPGLVEHDAQEIWTKQLQVIKGAIDDAGVEALVASAERQLGQFVGPDGGVVFPAPAHIATWEKGVPEA